jgi:L-alanine-DL-glutamate epimerase-like enolase superfamily enzyme
MVRIVDASVSFSQQRLAAPLAVGAAMIDELTLATANVVVEDNGRVAAGSGAVYLSDVWAWPDESLSHQQRVEALQDLCKSIGEQAPKLLGAEAAHPLEIGLRIHALACEQLSATPSPPTLARALCGSPFDAAVHDAAGQLVNASAFALYADATPIPSADHYFPGVGACRAIASLIKPPKRELPAWYVVGMAEPLEDTLPPAIRRHGYRCFKLKLSGRGISAEVARTVEVYRAAREACVRAPRLTVDSNEGHESADAVLEYLEALEVVDADAYRAVEYLEQPTSRDLAGQPFDWRKAAARKPVLLDEGFVGMESLAAAGEQGYSGLALKTCKGHSMLLVAAAWAHRAGMMLSLQDLTNPGVALIHAALVGAHLPTVNGAELNSPQFTPAANAEYAERLPELFVPRNGVHRLPGEIPTGLGSRL